MPLPFFLAVLLGNSAAAAVKDKIREKLASRKQQPFDTASDT